jgi:hypothetical protein
MSEEKRVPQNQIRKQEAAQRTSLASASVQGFLEGMPIMFSGLTHESNCSAVTRPDVTPASFRVILS